MARKNNQQKNGVERHSFNNKKENSDVGGKRADAKKRKTSEVKVSVGEELPNGKQPGNVFDESMNEFDSGGCEIKNEPKSVNFTEKSKVERTNTHEQSKDSPSDVRSCKEDVEASSMRERMGTPFERDWWKSNKNSSLLNGLHIKTLLDNLEFSDNVVVRSLKLAAMSVLKSAGELLEQQRPMFNSVITKLLRARDSAEKKIKQTYPIVLKWLMHFGNILLLISMVWLDCALRGLDSFLRMGTTSFFSVLWCSIFSVIAMVGLFKFLMVLGIAAFLGVFIGFILAIAAVVIFGMIFLWLYGSFWITTLVIILGGLAFILSHERVALLITTVYSVYCAWTYVGWLGVLLGLNLSFFSSDIMIYLLKNNTNEHRRPNRFSEQTNGMQGRHDFFNVDPVHDSPSETGPGISTDRNSGIPSTSGADSDITSEDEVIRLLNCTDHYSALGFSRYDDIDVSLLKKEYRKKAMLVHPDKNMGNEKAAEAFKKLQNAYEVLLDSLKRKSYDDELRREELLNIFRRFQSSSQKNGARGFFPSQFGGSENDGDDPFGESRQIACKKCNNFHMWAYTGKQKSRARWCQDCKDFHQAKDGDGWVEQTSQSLLFGLFQKVDAPSAYVCADSKIYNATEWYICQGMRCPANTHKPSFHVNTNVTSKHSTGKRTNSGPRTGRNPEEGVTEEEFFEWLQNAAQAGVFGEYSGNASADSPTAKAGNTNKNGGGSGGGGGSKRKKKGKKQW